MEHEAPLACYNVLCVSKESGVRESIRNETEEKTQMKKYVYMFPEGNGKMRELLGGKGANLAEMTGLGMPVPQGFTITTEACTRYYEDGKTIYPDIQEQIMRVPR